MADKKDSAPVLERTYNVPLRREYQKAPRWKRTEKAVVGLRQFLSKHMKSQQILLSTPLNNELWKHGIKNPPHHVKVTAVKDKAGVVHAELFGVKEESKKTEHKATKKHAKEEKKEEVKEAASTTEEKKESKPKKGKKETVSQ